MLKKICCLVLDITVCLTAFSGCVNNGAKPENKSTGKINNVLTISYYDGRYGSKWIQAIAAAYKKNHLGVKIILKADTKLDEEASNLLESSKAPDIIFLSNTNWQSWASKGYLENLTGLFTTVVDNGKTLETKLRYDCLKHCKYNHRYYVVPWDDGVSGFVYNKKMFKEHKWKVPVTMRQFYALLKKIKAAGIVPVAWDGGDISDWSYPVNNWWAQSEGSDCMRVYLKMGTPVVFLQKGRTKALKAFQKIVSVKENSMDNVGTADKAAAEKLFFGSKAAMMPGGSWTQCEDSADIPQGFSLGIMRTPAIDGAKDAKINVEAAGGFAVIPYSSEHKALAKSFLKCMSTDNMLELYTRITSSPRPFRYDAAKTKGLNSFGMSVMKIWQNSNRLYWFSDNPIYYGVFSDWPKDGEPFTQIYYGLISPERAVISNYKYAKAKWADAKRRTAY